MNPHDTSRVYRVRLACDLATGLENPGSMEEGRRMDGTDVSRFSPQFTTARMSLAVQILNAYSLDLGDVSIYMELTNHQLMRVINTAMQARSERQEAAATEARRIREAAVLRHQERRGSRARRDAVEVDALAEEEAEETPRRTPRGRNMADPQRQDVPSNEVSPWGPGIMNYGGAPMPPPRGASGDPVNGYTVDDDGMIIRPERKAKKSKAGPDLLPPFPRTKPKPGKVGRRLVIGRARPPVAPDE